MSAVELQRPFQCRQGLWKPSKAVFQAAHLSKEGRLFTRKGFGLAEFPAGPGGMALPQENRTPRKMILESVPVGLNEPLPLVEGLKGRTIVAATRLNSCQAQLGFEVGLKLQRFSQIGLRLLIVTQLVVAETQNAMNQGILAILPDLGQQHFDGSTKFALMVIAQPDEPIGGGGHCKYSNRGRQAQGPGHPRKSSSPRKRGNQGFHEHSAPGENGGLAAR